MNINAENCQISIVETVNCQLWKLPIANCGNYQLPIVGITNCQLWELPIVIFGDLTVSKMSKKLVITSSHKNLSHPVVLLVQPLVELIDEYPYEKKSHPKHLSQRHHC